MNVENSPKLSKMVYWRPIMQYGSTTAPDSLEYDHYNTNEERRQMRLIRQAERDYVAEWNKKPIKFEIKPLTQNGVEPTLLLMEDEDDPFEGLKKIYLSDDDEERNDVQAQAGSTIKEEEETSEADQTEYETDENTSPIPPLQQYDHDHARVSAEYSGNVYNVTEPTTDIETRDRRTQVKKSSIFKMIPLKRPERRVYSENQIEPIKIDDDEIERVIGHLTVPDYIASVCNVQPSTAQAAIVSRLTEENRVEKIRHSRREGSYPSLSVDEIKLEREHEHILRFAWKGKTLKLVHLLSDRAYHADINRTDECGRTACHFAASWGDKHTLAVLLKVPGVDFNKRDDEGKTPLYKAVEVNSLRSVGLLMNYGANSRIVANDNRTPFEFALQNNGDNAIEIIRFFLTKSELHRVDYRDGIVSTLHQLCLSSTKTPKYETAKALLAAGADVNAVDGEDRTPLMLAAKSGFEDIVKLLLESGAKPLLLDRNHEDAIEYCKGNDVITRILTSAIQKPVIDGNVKPPIKLNHRANTFRSNKSSKKMT